MNIILYTHSKNTNSTKKPSNGTTISACYLKDGCSVSNPLIVFTSISKPTAYNYAYIGEFNRYYFIDDWTYDRNEWIATLSIDVLATWKTSIGTSTQYIERSGKAGEVIDTFYPQKAEPKYIQTLLGGTDVFNHSSTMSGGKVIPILYNGTYVVRIMGCPTNSLDNFSGVNTYFMTVSELMRFKQYLSNVDFTEVNPDIDGITKNVAKLLTNPFEYVLSCTYYDITRTKILNAFGITNPTLSNIKYGYYEIDTVQSFCLSIGSLAEFSIFNGSVPIHPSYAVAKNTNRNSFMYLTEAYATYELSYPYIGVIKLPNECIYEGIDPTTHITNVNIVMIVDFFSNNTLLQARNFVTEGGTTKVITTNLGEVNIGIDTPIFSYQQDTIRAKTGLFDTAANATKSIFRGDIIGAGQSIFNGAINHAEALYSIQIDATGNQGGFTGWSVPPVITLKYVEPNVLLSYTPRLGQSTCSYEIVSGCAKPNPADSEVSIIKCANVSIKNVSPLEPAWYSEEYDSIINYMEDGFYYE